MKKVYLAGQPNEYADDWKEKFQEIKGFSFYDPEIHSDQSSSDTFYPQDLEAVEEADILVANPGVAPSEATWVEIGYFLRKEGAEPGTTSPNILIIWNKERINWSIEFIKKVGVVVETVEEAVLYLKENYN